MTSSGSSLPDYAKPPVVEVVFATAINPLSLSLVELAQFGVEKLDGFPTTTEQPPTQMPIEAFDAPLQMLAPTLALLTGAPPIRLWFQSEDRTRLVQLQRDWLACNWQGGPSNERYPRYQAIEKFFLETWDSLSQFAHDRGTGTATASQCELSYINHIVPGSLWERHGQISKVVRLAGKASRSLPEPEDCQVGVRYRVSYEGRDVGRLYVTATPSVRQEDGTPVIQLNLVARGAPLAAGRDGMVAFFRLAHEWIVNGFAAVTTAKAQESLWERIR